MQELMEIEGLGVARLELVGRYVEAAAGPLPRVPLRFWIRGEWVELSAPEPEDAEVTQPVVATGETEDPWSAVRARDLPVYRWRLERVTDDDEADGPGRGQPRTFALASGSGRPIGRRPTP